MSAKICMKDMDNRDDRGVPFSFVGTVEQVIAYIDGPVRNDTRDQENSLDQVIGLLRANVFTEAIDIAKMYGVYLSLEHVEGDNIKVVSVGDDGDHWLVTGTTDAHSVDEAVRQHIEAESGSTIEALLDAEDLVEFTMTRYDNLIWLNLGLNGEPDEKSTLAHATDEHSPRTFSGYMVTA